jgi:hypothetical protein
MVVSQKKKNGKEKVPTCVLIINHFGLNEDELELGTEVGGGYFFSVGRVFDFIKKHQLSVDRFSSRLFQEVLRTAGSHESTVKEKLEFIIIELSVK